MALRLIGWAIIIGCCHAQPQGRRFGGRGIRSMRANRSGPPRPANQKDESAPARDTSERTRLTRLESHISPVASTLTSLSQAPSSAPILSAVYGPQLGPFLLIITPEGSICLSSNPFP